MKIALYPGSFDPVTNGHVDVIKRARMLFDRLIVAVAVNKSKTTMFSMEERKRLLKSACRNIHGIEIICFDGLLLEAVRKYKASAVVRGLRAISDFEYEFQMALMNRELHGKYETVFLMSSPEYSFVSSRIIKEIISLGGDISPFVPAVVAETLRKKSGR